MKKIILEIDSGYDDVISLTAIGVKPGMTNVSTGAYKIEDGDCITVGADGRSVQKHAD